VVAAKRLSIRFWQILLQKSKVASVRIFGEFFECNATDDSYNLSRAAEIACELWCGDEVPHIHKRKRRLRLRK
jgi:hypothetical protein